MDYKAIKCLICRRQFKRITGTHLKKHHTTIKKYKIKFKTNIIDSPFLLKHRQDKIKGKTYEEIYGNKKMADEKKKIHGKGISKTKQKQLKEKMKSPEEYSRKAFNYYERKCMKCGETKKELAVHHKDRNKLNNHLKNLQILCRSCHKKLHHEMDRVNKKFMGDANIEQGFFDILIGLKKMYGLNLRDKNFFNTPKRVARAYAEIFEGINCEEKIKDLFSTSFPSEYKGMVILDSIVCFSMCPHHFLPVEYRVHLGYISENKMVGLSKLPRVVELLSKQPIMQETFTQQIVNIIHKNLKAKGVITIVEGKHMCMRMRGVKKPESITTTSALTGIFKNYDTKQEFLALIEDKRGKW